MKKTLVIVFVVFSLLSSSAPGESLDRKEITDLFHEGNDLFRQANEQAGTNPEKARELYLKAAMRFERITREGGIHNGKLYYNIGNAYFRMKDIGRTILNYRRAEQYIPGDPNLRQNLQFARERRVDKIDIRERTLILKTIFFWHYDLPGKVRSIIFACSFVFLWLFTSIRIFVQRLFTLWGIALSGTFALLFLGSLIVDMALLNKVRPGVIVGSEVVARKGDSETYEKSFKEPLHAGTEFRLIEKRSNWYHIELDDARTCWLPLKSVELIRQGGGS